MSKFQLTDVNLRNKPILILIGILAQIGVILVPLYLQNGGLIVAIILSVVSALSFLRANGIRKTFTTSLPMTYVVKPFDDTDLHN